MKGFWKMLTGQGEQEYREQHKRFDDAIPDRPGFSESDHPAVSGSLAQTSDAFGYRRANACHGPKSKQEHKAFAAEQQLQEREGQAAPAWEWLEAR